MFHSILPSFFRCSSRLLTAAYKRNVISSVRLYSIESFQDDFRERERKYNKVADETRTLLKTSSEEPKSVLFEMSETVPAPLHSCTSVEEVLDYLKCNPKIDLQFYAPIYNTIFKLYKSGKTKLSATNICRTVEIESLSKNVKKNVRFLQAEDAITILKVLTYFEISTNSILCQSLLQMISKHVNRLGIKQILFLHFILGKCARSPLADGLKIAIPIVFENHVRSQIDVDDTSTLTDSICFAFSQEPAISNETRKMLVDIALEKIDQFELQDVYGMVKKLKFTERDPENIRDLYRALMNILNENIEQLHSNQIITVVGVCIDKYINVHESFFDEKLIKNSINYFINNKIGLNYTGALLRKLDKVSFYCPEFLNYMDELLLNVKDFNEVSKTTIISFIKVCSNCIYKPKNWSSYEHNILSFIEEEKDKSRFPLVRVVIDLMILKCWPKTLVEYCFQKEFLNTYLSRDYNKLDYISLLSLYHVVKLLYADYYAGPYLPAEIHEKAVAILSEDKEYPILGALETGLGGSQYVLNGVKTKLGQIIDYLIVKCKSGQIYPINSVGIKGTSNVLYESLHVPEDSYSIAIVLLSPASYCLDGIRLRGKIDIILRCLETYGITTIPISYYQWLELQDCEKIPYLMDKINRSVPVTSQFKCSSL